LHYKTGLNNALLYCKAVFIKIKIGILYIIIINLLCFKQEGHAGPAVLTLGSWIKETLVLTGTVEKKFKDQCVVL